MFVADVFKQIISMASTQYSLTKNYYTDNMNRTLAQCICRNTTYVCMHILYICMYVYTILCTYVCTYINNAPTSTDGVSGNISCNTLISCS